VVDAGLLAVAHRAVGPQRGPASADRVEHRLHADDVEVGVLLPGEAGRRQVLGGGRGAHGDRHVPAVSGRVTEPGVGGPHRRRGGLRDRRGQQRRAGAPGQIRATRGQHVIQPGGGRRGQVAGGVDAEPAGDREAGRDELGEVRALPADQRQLPRGGVVEADDGRLGRGHEQR
jgi:hypothetical protein